MFKLSPKCITWPKTSFHAQRSWNSHDPRWSAISHVAPCLRRPSMPTAVTFRCGVQMARGPSQAMQCSYRMANSDTAWDGRLARLVRTATQNAGDGLCKQTTEWSMSRLHNHCMNSGTSQNVFFSLNYFHLNRTSQTKIWAYSSTLRNSLWNKGETYTAFYCRHWSGENISE
jgi:hypothetical protein